MDSKDYNKSATNPGIDIDGTIDRRCAGSTDNHALRADNASRHNEGEQRMLDQLNEKMDAERATRFNIVRRMLTLEKLNEDEPLDSNFWYPLYFVSYV